MKFLVYIFLVLSFTAFSQKNRFNKKGERKGKWLTYSDSAKTKKLFKGKYRNGNTRGKCLYYSLDGSLERKEINRFHKLKTTFYYPDGTIRTKGQARIENTKEKIHYYFYGTWKYYDPKGKLEKYCVYNNGEIIETRYVDESNKTNDSLMTKLSTIESVFSQKNQDLIDSIAVSWANQNRAEHYRAKIFRNDSSAFEQVEKILNIYGYPDKKTCHEACNVPFFIMSYAPVKLREKYTELFKAAAGIGSISNLALTYYIDKIKVAKGEKQVYGTQFYFDKDRKIIFYPSTDPGNLNKRRAAMGLEEQ